MILIYFGDIFKVMKTMDDLKDIVEKIENELVNFFSKPQNPENEFAYFQLLIFGGNACKGIREPWADAEDETIDLYWDTLDLIKELDGKMQLRLMLFLYSHIYEAKIIPRMLYNFLTLKKDGSYNERPFPKRNEKQERSTEYKLKDIKKLAKELKLNSFCLLIDEIYNEKIRNAFFHSDYNFNQEGLVINCNRNMNQKIIKYPEFNYYLNLMYHFFQIFLKVWEDARKSQPKNYKFKYQGQTVYLISDKKTNVLIGLKMGY